MSGLSWGRLSAWHGGGWLKAAPTFLLLLATWLAPLAAAVEPTPPDHQDFVFLASARPVLLRVRVEIGGRPCSAAWGTFLRQLFAWLDRDGDGTLSEDEVERAPDSLYLLAHFQGRIGFDLQGHTLRLAEVDADKDGKVTPAELAAHYRRAPLGPVRLSFTSSVGASDAVTEALFRRLDADKNGKLSAREWENAPALLRPLDENEDEMLTPAELAPGRTERTFSAPAARDLASLLKETRQTPHPLLEIRLGEPADPVAREILAHYDRDNDSALRRGEFGLDADTFAALDADRDDRLDAAEIAAFLRRRPDAECTARLGPVVAADGVPGLLLQQVGKGLARAGAQPVRIETPRGGLRLASVTARRLGPQTLDMALGDAALTLDVSDIDQPPDNTRSFYLQQFRRAARKGVLERRQARQTNFISEIFDIADRNGDGKLTERELAACLDLLQAGAASTAVLTATDQGRSLFDLLDTDGDGRLSQRELRSAWARLRPHAADEAGLAKADIPRRVQMALGLGRQALAVRPLPGESATAPLWFRKMDRNNDGDLSRREFLGTEEDFTRLDVDKDGLISAAEARQSEGRLKKDRNP